MNKLLLESLIRLFAYITAHHPSLFVENVKLFIQSFLRKEFSTDILNEYMLLFNDYHDQYKAESKRSNDNDLSLFIYKYFSTLSSELNISDRFLLLIRLLFFHKFLFKYQKLDNGAGHINIDSVTREIARVLNINDADYRSCISFIFEKLYDIKHKENLLVVGNKNPGKTGIHFIERERLKGNIYILKISGANIILFYYKGSDSITIDDFNVFPENIYIFHLGSKIDGETIDPLYITKSPVSLNRSETFLFSLKRESLITLSHEVIMEFINYRLRQNQVK